MYTLVMAASLAANTLFLPNASMTPGKTGPYTAKQICAKGFSTETIRNVSNATKLKVYKEYGLAPNKPPCPCEVDHLIALEIGGANDITNLWPQPRTTKTYNANVKDKLENATHRLVCAGKMSLHDAQHGMATDWVALYGKVMGHAKTQKTRTATTTKRNVKTKRHVVRGVAHLRRSRH